MTALGKQRARQGHTPEDLVSESFLQRVMHVSGHCTVVRDQPSLTLNISMATWDLFLSLAETWAWQGQNGLLAI